MGTPTAALNALATAGVSLSQVPTTALRFNPLVASVTGDTYSYKEAPMGTMNGSDMKAAVEASSNKGTTRVSIKGEDGKHAFYVRVPRPSRKLYTTPLVEALGALDETAADEVFMRLRHSETLKPHNRTRLQKAFDAFLVAVPGWVDPVAIAVEVREAELAENAKDDQPAPAPVEVPVAVADENAELRSQVWALTVAVKALAEGLGVEVPV